MSRKLIKCSSVDYRQGFIEILPNIHDGHINIEAWRVHPDISLENHDKLDHLTDGNVTGNVELELTLAQAKELVDQLNKAITQANIK